MNGYKVVEARSYAEGYMRANAYKPQALVIDNILDSVSCLATCKKIQSLPNMETAEFVIFTNYENELLDTSSIKLKGTLTKPYILSKLREYFPPLNREYPPDTSYYIH